MAVASATADALRTAQAQRVALKAAAEAAKAKVHAERSAARAAGERCMAARQQGSTAEQLAPLRAARLEAMARMGEAVKELRAVQAELKALRTSVQSSRKVAAKAAGAAAVGTTDSPNSGTTSESTSSLSEDPVDGGKRRGGCRGMRGMGMGHGFGRRQGWQGCTRFGFGPGPETTVTGGEKGAEHELSGLCGSGVRVVVGAGKEVVVRPLGAGRWVVVDRAVAPRRHHWAAQQ